MIKIHISGTRLRLTQQRQIILDELRKAKSHPTADEIYQQVRRRLPKISLGTVYRNLDLLSTCGMIKAVPLGSGQQKRFDGDTKPHYHLRCLRCGRVVDAPLKPVISIHHAMGAVEDCEVIGHHFEFTGLCPQCKSGKAVLAEKSPSGP